MKVFLAFCLCLLPVLSYADMSLSDLGIKDSPNQTPTENEIKWEQTMAKRTSMLKTHEVLGLATWGLMSATMLTGGSALSSDMHMYLGMSTAALYFTTAYFSLTAPKPSNIKDKARMKWHKALAWIHFPLMILVPYLGYMYKKHEEDGKKHNSLEKQHSAFAGALYGTFTLSMALMVIEF